MTAPTATRTVSPAAGAWILFLRVAATYRNAPGLLAVTLAAPLGMMLLFGFVFGGALAGGSDAAAYRSYLTPGVLVLVAAMGLVVTASTVNADLRSGLTDRLRALPVPPVAVPAGLALAETVTGASALATMAGVGFLAGWRVEATPADVALAVLLLLAFRFALAWLGIVLGASIRDEQMLQQVAPLIFGAVMFSNVFVPTETMPAVVATIAEWNPVSAVVAALRQLFGSGTTVAADAAWPMQHPVVAAFAWTAVILAVSVPIAVRGYASSR
ncbi:ABC transporter permease [Rhodococcus aetherivorans]|uniref:Transport permease protein n=1 Tax=Rhodococcus aetherivorans TaxID=191292 RepID=A0ABQ0YQH9_9NOCA|nr:MULTISPECIES: ABC transporter permease [Rhodococcus]ETT28432.1 ABC-2 type transporter [Rhodococcus rhodochrous ATCC 21198]MDV6295852.1 ABC transporter permease [Rhodococcus aetherivorans]NGP25611.1 ABC transporter permease [Rhodococcus aetherivorans]QIX52422.1 ABC transporter permease [Rhodococcus sp. DMU1]UGQ41862.1 ABC transporter permease [Rhodococcus aetherivorans]